MEELAAVDHRMRRSSGRAATVAWEVVTRRLGSEKRDGGGRSGEDGGGALTRSKRSAANIWPIGPGGTGRGELVRRSMSMDEEANLFDGARTRSRVPRGGSTGTSRPLVDEGLDRSCWMQPQPDTRARAVLTQIRRAEARAVPSDEVDLEAGR